MRPLLTPTAKGPRLGARVEGPASLVRALLLYAGYRTKPRFLILGAQKAGTTALFSYLARHPQIAAPGRKEIGFFSPEALLELPSHKSHDLLCGDGDVYRPLSSRRKRAWYHAHFPLPHRLAGRLAFEAMPEYLYLSAAAERIHAYEPRMKLIALVREPAARAFSARNMYSGFGESPSGVYGPQRETRTFAHAVETELAEISRGTAAPFPGYVQRGLYAQQLERYLELFPNEQMLVLDSAALAADTHSTVNDVLAFLELPAFPEVEAEWPREHVGEYGDDSADLAPTFERLREFYAPHNERLRSLLEKPPTWLRA
jgi:hypothetical protein